MGNRADGEGQRGLARIEQLRVLFGEVFGKRLPLLVKLGNRGAVKIAGAGHKNYVVITGKLIDAASDPRLAGKAFSRRIAPYLAVVADGKAEYSDILLDEMCDDVFQYF